MTEETPEPIVHCVAKDLIGFVRGMIAGHKPAMQELSPHARRTLAIQALTFAILSVSDQQDREWRFEEEAKGMKEKYPGEILVAREGFCEYHHPNQEASMSPKWEDIREDALAALEEFHKREKERQDGKSG